MRDRHSDDLLLIIGILLTILICSVPFKQQIEVTEVREYTSDENQIEISFGGPKVTWVLVTCNRSAEIRFLHQTGVWTSTETVLLASYRSPVASHNFMAEHSTNIVEVVSEEPVQIHIVYTYLTEVHLSILMRVID